MPQRAVKVNAVSYNSALSACDKGGQWQLVLGMFRSMPRSKIRPDVVGYTGAIRSCDHSGQWQQALQLFDDMLQSEVAPDVIACSALISCCKGGQWQLALSVLDRMPKAKIAPNAISYTSAMGACEKGGQWHWALELFTQLSRSKLTPNAISHSCALSACQSGAQWQRALVLFGEMFQTQLSPDVVSYSAALAACARGGRWRLAIHFFEGMKEHRIRPNVVAYNAALDCLQQREAGDSLLHEAIRDGIFDPLRRETPCDMLDLHEMSSGSARAAILWWLRDVLPPQLGDADSLACTIITGWGRSRRPWQQANLQADVLMLLRRFGLPAKVIQSNHGRVELQLTRKDLTPLLKEYDGPLAQPIIAAAGSDISFWFDEATGKPKMHVNPDTGLQEIYCPWGRYIHVPPQGPESDWGTDFAVAWWENPRYLIGLRSARTRKVSIVDEARRVTPNFRLNLCFKRGSSKNGPSVPAAACPAAFGYGAFGAGAFGCVTGAVLPAHPGSAARFFLLLRVVLCRDDPGLGRRLGRHSPTVRSALGRASLTGHGRSGRFPVALSVEKDHVVPSLQRGIRRGVLRSLLPKPTALLQNRHLVPAASSRQAAQMSPPILSDLVRGISVRDHEARQRHTVTLTWISAVRAATRDQFVPEYVVQQVEIRLTGRCAPQGPQQLRCPWAKAL
ncbi:unnamed protein product [Symbiodinium microadriaticum]|nr:unnamed protein product [Symbiodinium microadriaticum]